MLRSERYWLKYFIEHLLHLDGDRTQDLVLKDAEDLLFEMRNLNNWVFHMSSMKTRIPALKRHPALFQLDAPEPDCSNEQVAGQEFYELVRTWRAEHPAPELKTGPTILEMLSRNDDDEARGK